MTDLTELSENLPWQTKGRLYALDSLKDLVSSDKLHILAEFVSNRWKPTTDPVWAQCQLDLLELDIRYGRHLGGSKENDIEYSPD